MRLAEVLRLVFINLFQNKFKVVMTSIGIVVGAATIVMVIAIGRGGQMDVADQFRNLNAGAIDITYTRVFGGSAAASGSGAAETSQGAGSGALRAEPCRPLFDPGGGAPPDFPGSKSAASADFRVNFERITLSDSDVEDLEIFVPGIADATIAYTTRSAVTGGTLESETTCTIAGVKPNYAQLSNLTLAAGDFISDSQANRPAKVCVLGPQRPPKISRAARPRV
jgi:putative ABC transport system permease protein